MATLFVTATVAVSILLLPGVLQVVESCAPCDLALRNGHIKAEKTSKTGRVALPLSSATYICDSGYKPTTTKNGLICRNGNWQPEPFCILNACSDPPNPKNGRVFYKPSVNVAAWFMCDTGFDLVGNSTIYCVDGQWTASFPKCRKWEPCGLTLENGVILATRISDKGRWAFPKSLATYHCGEGFRRGTARKDISCEFGKWRPSPSCIPRGTTPSTGNKRTACSNPPFVQNAKTVDDRLYNNNEVLRYECKGGYRHRALTSAVVVCKNSKWVTEPNMSPMQCDPFTCDPLTRDENGFFEKIKGEGFAYDSTYRIGCNHGYQFDNYETELETRCNEDGRWSIAQSKCQSITCPALVPAENSILQNFYGRNFDYGSVYVMNCKPGYRSKATKIGQMVTLECGKKGKWSNEQPTCEVIYCEPLKEDENGGYVKLFGEKFNFQAVYRVSCNLGYKFHGMGPGERIIMMCNEYGVWTKHQPICEKFDTSVQISGEPNAVGQRSRRGIKGKCPSPPTIQNAFISKDEPYSHGALIRYECESGYQKQWYTTSFLDCYDGRWERIVNWDMIRCNPVKCQKLETEENGIITSYSDPEISYKASVYVRCKTGYTFSYVANKTEEELRCTERGEWSGPPSKCEVVRCSSLEDNSISYTFVDGTDFRYNSTCLVKCKQGYTFPEEKNESEVLITCMENGQWSPDRTHCEEIVCDKLEEDITTRYEFIDGLGNFRYNSKFRVKCRKGYTILGKIPRIQMEIRCMENGQWSSKPTKCEASKQESAAISTHPIFLIRDIVTCVCLEIFVVFLMNSTAS